MADNTNVANDRPRRSEAAQAEASSRMAQEVYNSRPTTDLSGEQCRSQPDQNQFNTLTRGVPTAGCDFRTSEQLSQQTGTLEFGNIWRDVSRSTVQIHVGSPSDRGGGTGVVIGSHNDMCIVATAAHVTHPHRFGVAPEAPTSRSVVMPDGRAYPAETRIFNRRNDQAILAVRTGLNTDNVCYPAQAADGYAAPHRGFAAGFPDRTNTPYISPAQVSGIRRDLGQPGDPRNDAPQHLMRTNITGGNSGGPVFNREGRITGLVSSGDDHDHGRGISGNAIGVASPFTSRMQRNYMDRIRSQR
jgi:S1-C subfamily serine protease